MAGGRKIVGIGMAGIAAFLFVGAAAAPVRRDAHPAARPTSVPAAVAARPSALGEVRPGLWEIAGDGPGAVPRRLCIGEAEALVQVAHPGAACNRLVIADGADRATVHYDCRGAGWGRTSLRIDATGDVAIDTQGIAGNAPFAWTARAHRTGDCRR